MSFKVYDEVQQSDRAMRAVYSQTLIDLAEKDERVVALEADLMNAIGNKAFRDAFPDRMFQCGVQEANMMGTAAGLSATGKIPFPHTFAVFASRRSYDQVFISAAYAKQNVKIVGSDPGILSAYNGGTHMAFEDMGILRLIPDITLIEPADGVALENLMHQVKDKYGLYYIRLQRKETTEYYKEGSTFTIGKGNVLRDGKDITLISSGYLLKDAWAAADELEKEGISVRLIDMFTWKPIDKDLITESAKKTGAMVTVENHNVVGGLGSAVAEALAETEPVPVERIGAQDCFGQVGNAEYLKKVFHMTAQDIVKAAKKAISRK